MTGENQLVADAYYHVDQTKGVKSFADDLVTGQGVVLSRAASTLRSVETQPSVG